MGDILIVRNLPAPKVVDVMISIARGIRDADGARHRMRYGVQPGVGPLTPSGAVNTGSDGEGAASPDSQASLPSQDELSRIDYCSNVIYDRGERRLLTDEGYVTFAADGTPQYHFYLRDHLGNIRVVFDQAGTAEQVTHYYPFGGVMRESTNPGLQPYKYGGKELDRTSGLDTYDFGARIYFADRLQWGQMDPMCEKYYDVSPYAYCGGNPINRGDLDGRDWFETNQGYLRWQPNVHSQNDLQKGFKYIGKSLKRNNATYRDDGTIMFTNESQAYIRMIHQERMSKTSKNPRGKEQMAFILNNGSVLVMPDNWNDSETSRFIQTGITRKNHILVDKHGNKYGYVAQVHTHPLGADRGLSIDDRHFAKADPDISVFVMHGDGYVYGGYYSSRRNGIDMWRENEPVPVKSLINGKRTLKIIADYYRNI